MVVPYPTVSGPYRFVYSEMVSPHYTPNYRSKLIWFDPMPRSDQKKSECSKPKNLAGRLIESFAHRYQYNPLMSLWFWHDTFPKTSEFLEISTFFIHNILFYPDCISRIFMCIFCPNLSTLISKSRKQNSKIWISSACFTDTKSRQHF